jgi:ABC-type polysaccharide/polyol phosphate export permease
MFWAITLGRLVILPNYFEFLLAGLLVMGVYNTSVNYADVIYAELRRGQMKYLLSLPVDRKGFALGRVVAGTVQGIVYSLVLLTLVSIFIRPSKLTGWFFVLGAIGLLSFAMSSLEIAIATNVRSDRFESTIDIVGLCLLYPSTVFYPESVMPLPLRFLSSFNAYSSAANLIRAGLGISSPCWGDFGVLLVWDTLCAILSAVGLYRRFNELT